MITNDGDIYKDEKIMIKKYNYYDFSVSKYDANSNNSVRDCGNHIAGMIMIKMIVREKILMIMMKTII